MGFTTTFFSMENSAADESVTPLVLPRTNIVELEEENESSTQRSEDTLCDDDECTLFIGDLPSHVESSALTEMFSHYRIVDIQIKTIKGPKSFSYAFVRFASKEEASYIYTNFGSNLSEKGFRIGWAKRNCRLHVSNVDPSVSDVDLQVLFGDFGNLAEGDGVLLFKKYNPDLPNYAHIHFESRDCAAAARVKLNQSFFRGRIIKVEWHRPSAHKIAYANQNGCNNIIDNSHSYGHGYDYTSYHNANSTEGARIGSRSPPSLGGSAIISVYVQFETLDPEVKISESVIKEVFDQFGFVSGCFIKTNYLSSNGKRQYGYAFVHFENTLDGKKCAERAAATIGGPNERSAPYTWKNVSYRCEVSKNYRRATDPAYMPQASGPDSSYGFSGDGSGNEYLVTDASVAGAYRAHYDTNYSTRADQGAGGASKEYEANCSASAQAIQKSPDISYAYSPMYYPAPSQMVYYTNGYELPYAVHQQGHMMYSIPAGLNAISSSQTAAAWVFPVAQPQGQSYSPRDTAVDASAVVIGLNNGVQATASTGWNSLDYQYYQQQQQQQQQQQYQEQLQEKLESEDEKTFSNNEILSTAQYQPQHQQPPCEAKSVTTPTMLFVMNEFGQYVPLSYGSTSSNTPSSLPLTPYAEFVDRNKTDGVNSASDQFIHQQQQLYGQRSFMQTSAPLVMTPSAAKGFQPPSLSASAPPSTSFLPPQPHYSIPFDGASLRGNGDSVTPPPMHITPYLTMGTAFPISPSNGNNGSPITVLLSDSSLMQAATPPQHQVRASIANTCYHSPAEQSQHPNESPRVPYYHSKSKYPGDGGSYPIPLYTNQDGRTISEVTVDREGEMG